MKFLGIPSWVPEAKTMGVWDKGLCLIFQIVGSIQTFTYPVTWYKVKVKQKID